MNKTTGFTFNKAALAAFFIGLIGIAHPVFANERPSVNLYTAVPDADDDNTWEVNTWTIQSRRSTSFTVAPEYNFSPTFSVELELGWEKNKFTKDREKLISLEFTKILLDPARTRLGLGEFGFGLGIAGFVDWERDSATGGGFKHRRSSLLVPMALQLPNRAGVFHLNLGAEALMADKTRLSWGLGFERFVVKSTQIFFEVAGRSAEYRFAHTGVRYWAKKEKVALDISVGRRQPIGIGAGAHAGESFLRIGIGLYDLCSSNEFSR